MPCYLFTYHAYASWMPDREEGHVRRGEGILSADEKLNRELERRTWLSEGASRKQVKDQAHFDYLINEYVPLHRGWKMEGGRRVVPVRSLAGG